LYNTDTNIKLFCSNDYLAKNSLEILEKLTDYLYLYLKEIEKYI